MEETRKSIFKEGYLGQLRGFCPIFCVWGICHPELMGRGAISIIDEHRTAVHLKKQPLSRDYSIAGHLTVDSDLPSRIATPTTKMT